ncbi:ubiquinone/menaquinone biosynthesis methyltransferase [bacterium]|nr:ubiquinone/menaquinone biosynthesis methyltransferase [bacterium]
MGDAPIDAPDPASDTRQDEEFVSFGRETVTRAEKTRRVGDVFRSVASRYDLMNDLMSAGVHRIWKANLIARLAPRPGETLIDVAGGTGDVARAFLDHAERVQRRTRSARPAFAIVADINEAMLEAGRKRRRAHLAHVAADACRLPFADRSADALTISFGIRNVAAMDDALREFRRVLKPGGRFACLEFSRLSHSMLQDAYDRYSDAVIPSLGDWVTGDRESYEYLVESIRRFPDQSSFAARISDAGFSGVSFTNFTGGVAALHTGWAV